jgi:hypothetical protein
MGCQPNKVVDAKVKHVVTKRLFDRLTQIGQFFNKSLGSKKDKNYD